MNVDKNIDNCEGSFMKQYCPKVKDILISIRKDQMNNGQQELKENGKKYLFFDY